MQGGAQGHLMLGADGLAYVVLDARHMQVPNYRLAIRTDQPPIAADSIDQNVRTGAFETNSGEACRRMDFTTSGVAIALAPGKRFRSAPMPKENGRHGRE